MPAFTQLCSKINISLFDDTLTIYPKKSGHTHQEVHLILPLWIMIREEIDCRYTEVETVTTQHNVELGFVRYVHRNDLDHSRYHQDSFSMDDDHYHGQCAKTIDLPQLKKIAHVLIKYGLLTNDEGAALCAAYKQITEPNALPALPPVCILEEHKPSVSTACGALTLYCGAAFFKPSWCSRSNIDSPSSCMRGGLSSVSSQESIPTL